jgi:hypothetical protein
MTVTATPTEVAARYEALREAALTHRLDTDRRGLALLRREGMAAWAAAWTSCSPAPAPPQRAELDRVGPFAEPSAIVALLASMALSTLLEHPHDRRTFEDQRQSSQA